MSATARWDERRAKKKGQRTGTELEPHLCHALDCTREIPPRLLMCRDHWRMVPRVLQDDVWAAYVPGQEITKTPTDAYLAAAIRAVNAVRERELRNAVPVVEQGRLP